MLNRRTMLSTAALASVPLTLPQPPWRRASKDTIVLAMALEPPGLDPTAGAASSIAEVTLYNIFETLTKINPDGSVSPLLAESWEVSPDLRTYTFKLRKGVKFQNGEPFNAQAVKFSLTARAARKAPTRTSAPSPPSPRRWSMTTPWCCSPRKSTPTSCSCWARPRPSSSSPRAPTNATKPVGTGPYKLDNWVKGSSVTLTKWDGYRNARRHQDQARHLPLHQPTRRRRWRRCWPATWTPSRA
jgi:peptide/nickel transport system substrate-binding protein